MEEGWEAYRAAGAPCWQPCDVVAPTRHCQLPIGERSPFFAEPGRFPQQLKTLVKEVHSGQTQRMSVCPVTDTNRNRKAGKWPAPAACKEQFSIHAQVSQVFQNQI